ncbi:hypothetical protein LTR27_002684 [Elasticomyces elasticus]|nr:hypothetical protein LTR27_002684 [Elasticomyces elasticus]
MPANLDPALASRLLSQDDFERRARHTIITALEAQEIARAALPTRSSSARPAPTVPLPSMRTSMPTVVASNPAPVKPKPRPATTFRSLAPAPRHVQVDEVQQKLCIFDLPAELRVEIYKLVLENVIIHILPLNSNRHCPHALIRTSRQIRNEVLPLIHSNCRIRANVTDFDFSGMLAWHNRIPPSQQANLAKNQDLRVVLCTTSAKTTSIELRRWLHMCADPYRPQPAWSYSGAQAQKPVANDLRRRCKRMTEDGKRAEFRRMLDAIKVHVPGL